MWVLASRFTSDAAIYQPRSKRAVMFCTVVGGPLRPASSIEAGEAIRGVGTATLQGAAAIQIDVRLDLSPVRTAC
jgi:hypothetical protein